MKKTIALSVLLYIFSMPCLAQPDQTQIPLYVECFYFNKKGRLIMVDTSYPDPPKRIGRAVYINDSTLYYNRQPPRKYRKVCNRLTTYLFVYD